MSPVRARRRIEADADAVFAQICDVAALARWNDAIVQVVELPSTWRPGAEWMVRMEVLGRSWDSRSRLVVLDRQRRRFAYRSGTDDGNPSYAEWVWEVAAAPGGSEVTVSVALRPRTFWRRMLLGRIRRRQLARRELPASLARLAGGVEGA